METSLSVWLCAAVGLSVAPNIAVAKGSDGVTARSRICSLMTPKRTSAWLGAGEQRKPLVSHREPFELDVSAFTIAEPRVASRMEEIIRRSMLRPGPSPRPFCGGTGEHQEGWWDGDLLITPVKPESH